MRPRIRSVKPEFFQDEELYDMERETGWPMRLAYEGLWCFSDRAGRFEWLPRTLKSGILPHDDVDFSRVLDAFVTRGKVLKYQVAEKWYGLVINFPRHQSPNNREEPSRIPEPPSSAAIATPSTRAPRVPDASPTRAPRVPQLAEPSLTASLAEPSLTEPSPRAYHVRVVTAVNSALNRKLAGSYRPLVADSERGTADDWKTAGIPVELVEQIVAERVMAFKPKPLNKQPSTLKYFEHPVREAFERQRATAGNGAVDSGIPRVL
jgi:hypothetical protein